MKATDLMKLYFNNGRTFNEMLAESEPAERAAITKLVKNTGTASTLAERVMPLFDAAQPERMWDMMDEHNRFLGWYTNKDRAELPWYKRELEAAIASW